LLHGYVQWGIDGLLRRIRGMWAFALWDVRERKLFLVRDRLGVKPLIYAHRAGELAFASTVPALVAGGFAKDLDAKAVAEYLEFGYVTDQRAIFVGLQKLAAGTALEFCPGKGVVRQWQYWSLAEAESPGRAPEFEEVLERVEALFIDSVRLRLEADVPIGALLSGGIDSALVCWAIAKLGGDVRAYTVSTPGDPGDETADALLTAREIGIRHETIALEGSTQPSMAALTAAYGEPFACPSAIGMIQVSQAVKQRATVLLTGDGGDDVFLGYPEHRHLLMAQRLANCIPGFMAQAWGQVRSAPARIRALKRAVHFLDYACGGVGAVARARDGLQNYGALLGPRLAGVGVVQREIPWSTLSGRRVLQDFLQYDLKTRFVGEYLTKVDGGSMFHGLEARSPFLDTELWDYVARLPLELRLRHGSLKSILRALVSKRVSPRVAQGRKRGFSVPTRAWMTTRWREDVDAAFADSHLAAEGWVDGKRLQSAWSAAKVHGRVSMQLWYLFVLENWHRNGSQGPDLIVA
jgi:asparagine synthase (glutamine-hydrolysing)